MVYPVAMDWQHFTALTIVFASAAAFVWRGFAKRRQRKTHGHDCGCGHSVSSIAPPPSTVLRGRKGERPQLVVKAR